MKKLSIKQRDDDSFALVDAETGEEIDGVRSVRISQAMNNMTVVEITALVYRRDGSLILRPQPEGNGK